jgi:predicted phosphodiesterase
MKFLILSDPHLETASFDLRVPSAINAIMLAGDICAPSHNSSLRKLLQQTGEVPIFYIPGNHEFYNTEMQDRLDELRELITTYPNVRRR